MKIPRSQTKTRTTVLLWLCFSTIIIGYGAFFLSVLYWFETPIYKIIFTMLLTALASNLLAKVITGFIGAHSRQST